MQIYLYTVLKNSGVVEVIDNSRNSEPNHENREINYTCSPVEENLGSTAGAEVQEEGGGVIRGVTEQSYCRCGNSKRGRLSPKRPAGAEALGLYSTCTVRLYYLCMW